MYKVKIKTAASAAANTIPTATLFKKHRFSSSRTHRTPITIHSGFIMAAGTQLP